MDTTSETRKSQKLITHAIVSDTPPPRTWEAILRDLEDAYVDLANTEDRLATALESIGASPSPRREMLLDKLGALIADAAIITTDARGR